MTQTLSNAHMHVFTSKCAPARFLKVQESKLIKTLALPLKLILEDESFNSFINKLYKIMRRLPGSKKHAINRYLSFIRISTLDNQHEVFKVALNTAKSFESNPKLYALTMNMDLMDTEGKPEIPYTTQLQEVIELKHYYPHNFFPFLGIDPRVCSGNELAQWVKDYWEKTIIINNEIVPVFSGIKIYPALGFFPFDPSLDAFYKYASENSIPLLFHCTRTGSIYIGKQIETLIPKTPEMIFPETDKPYHDWAVNAKAEIIARINRYYEKSWVKNNSKGDNGHACDLFSHPQNYVPILAKYPNLKICLAHMGGGQEVEYMNSFGSAACKADKELKERWKVDNKNWAKFIQDIMKIFPSLYTDISSTNTRLGNKDVLTNIKDWLDTDADDGTKLGNRILFGSDYFLTEIDSKEESLYQNIKTSLPNWYEKMMDQNINNFVNSENRKITPIDKSEIKDIA